MLLLREYPSDDNIRRMAREFEELDPSAVRPLLRLIHTASEAYRRVDEYMAQHCLSHGRFVVLMLLHVRYADGLSPSALAEKIGVTRATMTSLVDRLERDGLVARERRTDDRRAVTVQITPRARRVLRRILPGHFARVAAMMANLTRSERSHLVRLLDKTTEGIVNLPPPSGAAHTRGHRDSP